MEGATGFVLDLLSHVRSDLLTSSSITISGGHGRVATVSMFVVFLVCVVFFHVSEFLLAFIYDRAEVSWRSWLISTPYVLAMGSACLEYLVEASVWPEMKRVNLVAITGVVMVIGGEAVRKMAMVTAQHAFTHDIKCHHRENHHLVTTGIYSVMRHPGYAGWFIWSIGTQVLLCNPICFVMFTFVTWRFFADRIPFEELYLRQFFGVSYEEYCRRVPSGLPCIP